MSVVFYTSCFTLAKAVPAAAASGRCTTRVMKSWAFWPHEGESLRHVHKHMKDSRTSWSARWQQNQVNWTLQRYMTKAFAIVQALADIFRNRVLQFLQRAKHDQLSAPSHPSEPSKNTHPGREVQSWKLKSNNSVPLGRTTKSSMQAKVVLSTWGTPVLHAWHWCKTMGFRYTFVLLATYQWREFLHHTSVVQGNNCGWFEHDANQQIQPKHLLPPTYPRPACSSTWLPTSSSLTKSLAVSITRGLRAGSLQATLRAIKMRSFQFSHLCKELSPNSTTNHGNSLRNLLFHPHRSSQKAPARAPLAKCLGADSAKWNDQRIVRIYHHVKSFQFNR